MTILVIEDDIEVLELTEIYLKRNDITDIYSETNPTVALESVDFSEVCCVICDFDLPEMNGLEVLDSVREENEEIPFILYTGKGSEEIASEAISKGVTDYMQKSTGEDHYLMLSNRVKNAIEAYQKTIESRENIESTLISQLRRVFNTRPESVENRIQQILQFGVLHLDTVDSGFLGNIDGRELLIEEWYSVHTKREDISGSYSLEDSYCQFTIQQEDVFTITKDSKHEYDMSNLTSNINTYIGDSIYVDGDLYGTLCFYSNDEGRFNRRDKEVVGLLATLIEREISIYRSQSKLESQIESLRDYHNILSHDLNNLFNSARGYLGLLEESDLDDQCNEYVSKAKNSVNRSISIVENAKIISSIEYSDTTKTDDAVEKIELGPFLRSTWDNFCVNKDSTFELQPTVQDTVIYGNSDYIAQMFGNLFVNAVEHNNDPVTVSVGVEYQDEKPKKICIEDTGSGFSHPIKMNTKDLRGTGGFGLFIVSKVCEYHEWNVEATNSPTGGAKFIIDIGDTVFEEV